MVEREIISIARRASGPVDNGYAWTFIYLVEVMEISS